MPSASISAPPVIVSAHVPRPSLHLYIQNAGTLAPRPPFPVVNGKARTMLWKIAKEAAVNWSSHNDARQGAALAYYSVFSLGPLIVIAIAIAGFVFGRDAASGQVTSSIAGMLGETGAKAVQA